jgi:hypothetical protein
MNLSAALFSAAGLFALSTAPGLAATNLLTNGSFESGLKGWTLGGTETQGYPAVVINYNSATPYPTGAFGEAVPPAGGSVSPDAAGAHAAYFVSDFANETLTQSIFLTPGTYTIGFSAYAPANGYANAGDALFSGSVAGVTLANYAVSSGSKTTWYNFHGLATITTAGVYDTTFTFSTDLFPSKDIVVDQVYVVAGNAVPEASTWVMMGLGFAGLAFAARRKQREARLVA